MMCPNCKEFVTVAVCPECQAPLKQRAGLQIPLTDTLAEFNYGIGKSYCRYYRIAILRQEENRPPKLAFGCEERPLAFLSGKQSWFNPVMIHPDNLEVLAHINTSQLASAIAFCTFLKESDRIDHAFNRFYKSMASPPMRKFLWDESVRFLRIMQH